MTFSPALALYRSAVVALGPFAGAYLASRAKNGKEDAARLPERFGKAYAPRPSGALMWLHAASVGESGVAAQIISALAPHRADLSFLVTTGTRTSAALLAKRALPRTLHAFAPLDRNDAVARFLAHWKPDIGIFVESEVWPNLILAAEAARIPLALVNARMSVATLTRWKSWRNAARRLLSAFSLVLAADERTAAGLSELSGKDIARIGNLKLAAAAPNVDPDRRAALEHALAGRRMWLAASTHDGEDEIILAAHTQLRERNDIVLVIAPRHPERGEAVAALAGNAPRRSQGGELGAGDVFVLDTMGELGPYYACADAAFIAGSLLPKLTGHNPVEAAKLSAPVLTGPYVESFEDLYSELRAADACVVAESAEEIAAAVRAMIEDSKMRQARVSAARAIAERGGPALAQTIARLEALLPERAAHASHAPA